MSVLRLVVFTSILCVVAGITGCGDDAELSNEISTNAGTCDWGSICN